MNLQFNHLKPVLLFLAIFTQCGLAAARCPYQSQQGRIATSDSPKPSKSAPVTGTTASPAASPYDNRLALVDEGVISGNTYTNHVLGFSTEFPAGWQIIDAAKQHALIEANHEAAFGDSLDAQREHEMVWRCTHILLWTSQDAENHLFIASVWNPSCFPEFQFPASSQDQEGIQHWIESMRHPPFGQETHIIEPDEKVTTFSLQGRFLLDISGSVSTGESTTHIAVVLAPLKNYWLSWMFAAPSSAALEELKKTVFSSLRFDVP